MAKEVEKVETFLPPKDAGKKQVLVLTTDDEVRYIFEIFYPGDTAYFSHRYYHFRPSNEKRVPDNHRLPRAVVQELSQRGYEVKYREGMMKEALTNKRATAKLNNEQDTQTA